MCKIQNITPPPRPQGGLNEVMLRLLAQAQARGEVAGLRGMRG